MLQRRRAGPRHERRRPAGGLNFPNFTGFSGQVLNQGPDRDVNLVMIKAYNDWHVDEWCGAYPGRFIPCGILPLFDVDRGGQGDPATGGQGCHAVTFSENPEALEMPSIHTKHWYPLFDAACETRRCCAPTSARRRGLRMGPCDAPPSVNMTASSMMSMFTFVELIWAEFWAASPNSSSRSPRATSAGFRTSSGAPSMSTTGTRLDAREVPSGYSGPTDIFKRHFYTCFISDKVGVKNMDWFNEDMLCWESDFPHSDSNWPFAPEDIIETMGNLDDTVINKITHENAMAATLSIRSAHPQGARAGRRPPRPGHRRRRGHPCRPPGQPA